MPWVVVGLSGVTNSGKSSLAKLLLEDYPGSLSLCQDSYFHPNHSTELIYVKEVNHYNWDHHSMSAIDMDKMVTDVHKIIDREPTENESGILILDGFLLLSHEYLSSLCSIKVYIDLDYEEVRKRRLTRNYDPPDVPRYFEVVVWPESRIAREDMFSRHSDLLILSGKDTLAINLAKVSQMLEICCPKKINKKPS